MADFIMISLCFPTEVLLLFQDPLLFLVLFPQFLQSCDGFSAFPCFNPLTILRPSMRIHREYYLSPHHVLGLESRLFSHRMSHVLNMPDFYCVVGGLFFFFFFTDDTLPFSVSQEEQEGIRMSFLGN